MCRNYSQSTLYNLLRRTSRKWRNTNSDSRGDISVTMTTKVRSETEVRISGLDGKRKEGERKWWYSKHFTKKGLRQILTDVTLHGVPHTVDTERAIWTRLLWLLVVGSSMGVFLTMFYWLHQDYYNYPYKTVISSTPTDRLPLPAVTLCNINTMDVSKVSYAKALGQVMSWTAFGKFTIPDSEATAEHWRVLNMSAQTILEETNPGVNGSFVACFYDKARRDCGELFSVIHWAMTRCFTLNVSKLNPASATTTLRVIMNINKSGYVVQDDKSVGVKFFIHPVDDVPNFNSHTSAAAPGFSTQVALQFQEMKMLEKPYKSYGEEYCIKTENIDTTNLPVNSPYRLLPCLKHRALKIAHENCTCKSPFESADPDVPECTLYQMLTCVMPILDNLIRENRFAASANLGCPLPCDYEQYLHSITFSYFPSPQAVEIYKERDMIPNRTDVRGNYLELNFYYSEMILRRMEYVPEYTSMSILGNIGGNMGFFLGASVVSLGEIAELVSICIFRLLCRLSAAVSGTRAVSGPS